MFDHLARLITNSVGLPAIPGIAGKKPIVAGPLSTVQPSSAEEYESIREVNHAWSNEAEALMKVGRSSPWLLDEQATAGLLAKLHVLPLDMVKKRLQVQGFCAGNHTEYRGAWDCFRCVLRAEGWRAFFRGGTAGSIKAVVVSGLTFSVHEAVLQELPNRQSS